MQRLNIAKLRKAHHMTQKQLAEKLGVQQSFLSAMEKGRSAIPSDRLEQILSLLPVDNLDNYMEEVPDNGSVNNAHSRDETFNSNNNDTTIIESSDKPTLKKLLNIVEKQLGQEQKEENFTMADYQAVLKKVEQLNDKITRLTEEKQVLGGQILKLKELCFRNHIDYTSVLSE